MLDHTTIIACVCRIFFVVQYSETDEVAEESSDEFEEDTPDFLTVELGDFIKIKQVLDETVVKAVLELDFTENHYWDNTKLALVVVACFFASGGAERGEKPRIGEVKSNKQLSNSQPFEDPPRVVTPCQNSIDKRLKGRTDIEKEAGKGKVEACAYCLRLAPSGGGALSTCSGCEQVAYCGKDCQTLHWKAGHKKQCIHVIRRQGQKGQDEATAEEPNYDIGSSKAARQAISSPLALHPPFKEKKGASSACNVKECANCLSSSVALHACTRCKIVYYCSRPCQILHWKKGGHQQLCISLEERKPNVASALKNEVIVGGSMCPVCLEGLRPESSMTLPCKHNFHYECVQGLRRFGVQQVCPLCRAELPPGPEKLFERAARQYLALERRQQMPGQKWESMMQADRKEAKEITGALRQAAAEGYAPAQTLLAFMYVLGQGVRQSNEEAARWYQKAADQGHTQAEFALGHMHEDGLGVRQSFEEAARWYRKAADHGDAEAQFCLGILYDEGQGVRQSFGETARWYHKAAEQGHAKAQYGLGVLYDKGKGVRQSFEEAARWCRKAADQKLDCAQYDLGVSYERGLGVHQSFEEAVRWYRKAADQGNPNAQFNLGNACQMGDGVRQDFKDAARWYRKAADQGEARAQHNLGTMYITGKGVRQDFNEAARWYRKAAEQGFPPARAALACLHN